MRRYSQEIEDKMIEYYEKYYTSVGLKDYKKRAKEKLLEEEVEGRILERLSKLLNVSFGNSQKHLIVGAGTGGLVVELGVRGCDVYAIEPNEAANEIIRLKLKEVELPNKIECCYCEDLPYHSNTFDFIHCFTVIEHVKDVEKCIDEMIRVLKIHGYIYINTPDYRFPYERHYKIPFPPSFFSKIFGYLYLLLRRKPAEFLRHLNFVTAKNIDSILYRKRVSWFRIYEGKNFEVMNALYKFFILNLGISPNQEIVIRKFE